MTEGQELLGTTIAGKYRVRRLVGLGGMGAVYEGEHVELGKRVAVKIIDGASAMSSELTTRFKREARAASAVESEHIVQVFDVGQDPEIGLYMVMEYLVGEDLEIRLRKEPGRRLDPTLAATVGHQVARALVKAHAARVIHRDLKPANIFLTQRDDGSLRVKVLDFGISKLLASDASIANKRDVLALTQEGVALGTPQYMSPEQAQGLTTIDHRTDVWSLGAVLYEAVAGRPAYAEAPTYEEIIMKILLEKPPPLAQIAPWVPDTLAEVIHDALKHDVSKRIPDCQTFAARLAAGMPGAVHGSSGPFNAVRSLATADTSPQAFRPQIPSLSATPTLPPADDTQVVIRPSSDGSDGAYDEESPSSRTMLAPGVGSSKGAPHLVARDSKNLPSVMAPDAEDAEALSTGDPTMFQAPAWVSPDARAAADGPTTLKTAVRSLSGEPQSRGILAATVTALIVIVVGGTIIQLSRGEMSSAPPAESATVGGPAQSGAALPATEPEEPTAVTPAPPPTGTGEAPVIARPPSVGALEVLTADGGVHAHEASPPTVGTAAFPGASPQGGAREGGHVNADPRVTNGPASPR